MRFFGGWDFIPGDAQTRLPAETGYTKGVPMGGDLRAAPGGKAPSFLVAALKDPLSGNLDRIQVIKGWVDAKGARQEKVYDVAWSGDRKPDAKGKLPAVGKHGRCGKCDVDQHDRRARADHRVARSRVRSEAARRLLRARDRDPDATLDRVRRKALRRQGAEGGADDDAGARVYLADLVHAGMKKVSAALIASALAASPVLGCGLHDDVSLQRGVMNWVYPDSLHVRSAVWRAQADGVLARDQRVDGDTTTEARTMFGLLRAQRLMNQLGTALHRASGKTARQPISVVLLGPLLWSRFEQQSSAIQMQFHVDGPRTGDAVVVTELATIEGLLGGELTLNDALKHGLLKIYAQPSATASAQIWLAAMNSPP